VCGQPITPPPPANIDPLDPASCQGDHWTASLVDAALPAGHSDVRFSPSNDHMSSHFQQRTYSGRAASNTASCTDWKEWGLVPSLGGTSFYLSEATDGTIVSSLTIDAQGIISWTGSPLSISGSWSSGWWESIFELSRANSDPLLSPSDPILRRHCARVVFSDPPTPNNVGQTWTEYRGAIVLSF
jgi:hypothetical protein